ncbi:MAG: GNAT family N-acetyltransferase [Mucilaginibacter sp.]
MEFHIAKAELADIEPHRRLFLAETKFQFIYNKCHGAGWADVYSITLNDVPVGYGSVWGEYKREERDTIFEFFLEQPLRKYARQVFTLLVKISGATFVKFQTNDLQLSNVAFESAKSIRADAILFENAYETAFEIPGTTFIKEEAADQETVYSIQTDGGIVATGGFVWNYNFPYIDIYYEVKENFRKQGFGTLITQELKKEAFRLGRVPAARCNVNNAASRATLLKAGMRICGYLLLGER